MKKLKTAFDNFRKTPFPESPIADELDDIYITYRSFSKSGPPTIDIKLPNTDKNIKLKFIE